MKWTKAKERYMLQRELQSMKKYVESRNKETLRYIKKNWKWSLKKCKSTWKIDPRAFLNPVYIENVINLPKE